MPIITIFGHPSDVYHVSRHSYQHLHAILDHFGRWELIYADGTMLVGHRARDIHISLAATEKESVKYSLNLNYCKCIYISMDGQAHIHFSNRQALNKVEKPLLGGAISK